jgi:hypothetical protein
MRILYAIPYAHYLLQFYSDINTSSKLNPSLPPDTAEMRSLTYEMISFVPSMVMSALAFEQRQRFIDYWNTDPVVHTTRTMFTKNMEGIASFYNTTPPVQLAQFVALVIASLFFFSVAFRSTPRRSRRKTVQLIDEDDVVVAKRPITRSMAAAN